MRRGDWAQTYTGRAFWPLDPRADEIEIEDIAWALAHQCRYAGHCRTFYSVAQHSCYVSDFCSPASALWGLMHDASEAYLCDIPRPLKRHLVGYKELEEAVMACVVERFGLSAEMPAEVKRLDNAILANERDQIMAPPPMDWSLLEPAIVGLIIAPWSPQQAYMQFMRRFVALGAARSHGAEEQKSGV